MWTTLEQKVVTTIEIKMKTVACSKRMINMKAQICGTKQNITKVSLLSLLPRTFLALKVPRLRFDHSCLMQLRPFHVENLSFLC